MAGGSATVGLAAHSGGMAAPAGAGEARPTTGTGAPIPPGKFAADVAYLAPDRIERGDVYLPAKGRGRSPAVVVIHGGGFNSGDKSDALVTQTASFLTGCGYAAFCINYKLGNTPRSPGPPWPTNLKDCKIAVQWLRANADRLDLDPRNIAALGMSAGGTLAAMLAVTADVKEFESGSPYSGISTAIQATVLFYPVMGKKDSATFSPGYGRKPPATYFRKGLPPFLILQGELDKLVPQEGSEEIAAELTALGVENRLVIVKQKGHGFGVPAGSDLRPVVQGFLDEHLKPHP